MSIVERKPSPSNRSASSWQSCSSRIGSVTANPRSSMSLFRRPQSSACTRSASAVEVIVLMHMKRRWPPRREIRIGGTMDDKVNLAAKFALLDGLYQPGIVGYINDYKLQVVRLKGPVVWHKHDATDDFL